MTVNVGWSTGEAFDEGEFLAEMMQKEPEHCSRLQARPWRSGGCKCLIRAAQVAGMLAGFLSGTTAWGGAAAAPAGIGRYSYIEVRGIDWGNSSFFGAPARGDGLKLSYRFGSHAYVSGQYSHLRFDGVLSDAGLNRAGVAFGLEGTAGKVSAYLQAGFYRSVGSGPLNGARSYYWEVAYGNRFALTRSFALLGEVYSDVNPEFGSRPYGLKAGVSVAFGSASLQVLADHNSDVNSLHATLRFAF